MAVLIDKSTRLLVQGITGREGTFHAKQAQAYGTTIVGGVTPGKGGTTHEGWPVFDGVAARRSRHGRERVRHFRAAGAGGADAIMEAADADLPLAVCITEGIPTIEGHDAGPVVSRRPVDAAHRTELPGPDFRRPRESRDHPRSHLYEGRVGIVSKSGTLTYEAIRQLTHLGLGQTTCIGIGGDPLIGTSFIDALTLFASDPETEAVVLIGEIGGSAEEDAAAFINASFRKPVVGFIAGQTRAGGTTDGACGCDRCGR